MIKFIAFAFVILGIAFAVLSIAIKIILVKKGYSISYIRTSIVEVLKFRKLIPERKLYKYLYYSSIFVLLLVMVVLVMLVFFIINLN